MSNSENTVNNLDEIMHTLVTTSSAYLLEKKSKSFLDKLESYPTYLKDEDFDNLSGNEVTRELNKRNIPGRNEDLELLKDRDFILNVIDRNANILQYCPIEFKNDKEIVLKCVTKFSANLCFASDNLKDDMDIVLAVINDNASNIKYASENLRNNKELGLKVVILHDNSLKYLSNELKNDKDVVKSAIIQNGWNLQLASNELKNNPYIVLAAVKQNKVAFNLASQEIRDMYDGDNPKEFLEQYIEKLELYNKLDQKIESTMKEIDKRYKKIKI